MMAKSKAAKPLNQQGNLMDANVQRWENVQEGGKTLRVPVPYFCLCGTSACYGKDGLWFCTTCWLSR